MSKKLFRSVLSIFAGGLRSGLKIGIILSILRVFPHGLAMAGIWILVTAHHRIMEPYR